MEIIEILKSERFWMETILVSFVSILCSVIGAMCFYNYKLSQLPKDHKNLSSEHKDLSKELKENHEKLYNKYVEIKDTLCNNGGINTKLDNLINFNESNTKILKNLEDKKIDTNNVVLQITKLQEEYYKQNLNINKLEKEIEYYKNEIKSYRIELEKSFIIIKDLENELKKLTNKNLDSNDYQKDKGYRPKL